LCLPVTGWCRSRRLWNVCVLLPTRFLR
jgi:hypothetical protein